MNASILGIHHVTAIASDPQRNVDFYTGVLGLRLVKLTVNFDDPGAYHLYYGDEAGHPGTILTFFSWPGARRRRQGTGQVGITSLAIRPSALAYWIGRFVHHGVRYEGPTQRFDEQVLTFRDPDGLALELVAHPGAEDRPYWEGGPVPAENAIRGLYGVTLWEEGYELTAKLLTQNLGFCLLDEQGSLFRYAVGEGGPGALVDVRSAPSFWQGVVAVGTVHHVAWRTPKTNNSSPGVTSWLTLSSTLPRSWIASTSTRSTFGSRAACCLRSRLIRLASLSTSLWSNWGHI